MGRELGQKTEDTRRKALSDNPSFPAQVPRGCSFDPPEMSSARAENIVNGIPDRPDEIDAGFVLIPNHLLERGWMFKGCSFIVYACLLKHARQGKICWPSEAKIGHMIRRNARNVREAIRHLEKMGLVKTNKCHNNSNTYHLIPMLTPKKNRMKTAAPSG